MADYYPLISRAVAGLEKNSGENRRVLYERARTALLEQLRGVTPALKESDITRERLALEGSIRQVEAEAARQFRLSSSTVSSVEPSLNASILKSGTVDGMAYTLYSDGSIEACLPHGTIRFPTIDDLRRHIVSYESNRERQKQAEAQRTATERQRQQEQIANRIAEQRRQQEELEKQIRDALRRHGEQEARRLAEQPLRRLEDSAASKKVAGRKEPAEVASPAPSINPVYEAPTASEDIASLPIRQREVIRAILGDLPGNAPRFLRIALSGYSDGLKVRGAQPILGLLSDMASIIEAAIGDPDAQEWLQDGMRRAFKIFFNNHALLVRHFPPDPKREELYARAPIDAKSAAGATASDPLQELVKAALDSNRRGLTTDDFLKVVDKMAEFAKVIASLPPPPSKQDDSSARDDNSRPIPTVVPKAR